jgi:hypothetical protein
MPRSQQEGRKPKLTMDRGNEFLVTAKIQDVQGLRKRIAHRFLDQHRRAVRQALLHSHKLRGDQCQIAHSIGRGSGDRLFDASVHVRDAELIS